MDITQKQLKELTSSIESDEPIAIAMTVREEGFKFIIQQERILDTEKYKRERGITVIKGDSMLGKFDCRILYSDGSMKVIGLREVR